MNSTLLIGMPGGGEWIIILIGFLIPLVCILDIMRSDFRNPASKWIWCAVVIFFPIAGSLLYYWIGTEQKVVSRS
ncbi:MAG TPA: PLD nuclease N-terminal domain-containing protein [Cyclobacteriaceae bacterium]|nr:PLD nuclease N-terminal domain-containing protein [Cyclobacteriaceae bacterium]